MTLLGKMWYQLKIGLVLAIPYALVSFFFGFYPGLIAFGLASLVVFLIERSSKKASPKGVVDKNSAAPDPQAIDQELLRLQKRNIKHVCLWAFILCGVIDVGLGVYFAVIIKINHVPEFLRTDSIAQLALMVDWLYSYQHMDRFYDSEILGQSSASFLWRCFRSLIVAVDVGIVLAFVTLCLILRVTNLVPKFKDLHNHFPDRNLGKKLALLVGPLVILLFILLAFFYSRPDIGSSVSIGEAKAISKLPFMRGISSWMINSFAVLTAINVWIRLHDKSSTNEAGD